MRNPIRSVFTTVATILSGITRDGRLPSPVDEQPTPPTGGEEEMFRWMVEVALLNGGVRFATVVSTHSHLEATCLALIPGSCRLINAMPYQKVILQS